MPEIEQLVVSLEGRFAKYEKDFERARRTTDRQFTGIERRAQQSAERLEGTMAKAARGMGGALKSIGLGLVGGVAGGLAIGGLDQIIGRIGQIAEGVATIGDEARRAGLGLEAFQELKFVAEQNRIGVDALVDGMKELNLRADEWIVTSAGPAAEAFTRLGFSASELKRRLEDPSALLVEIIGRMEQLDRAAQIRIADEIFGGTGGERFVELLDQGAAGIRATIDEAHELGVVMDAELVAKADELDRKFKAITTQIGVGLKTAIVSAADAFVAFGERFGDYDAEIVQNYQRRITGALEAIEEAEAKLAQLQDQRDSAILPGIVDTEIERQRQRIQQLQADVERFKKVIEEHTAPTVIEQTGDDAEGAKPKVDDLNSALNGVYGAAGAGATGIDTFAEAIRGLKDEIPELADQLADLDAQARIDGIWRAAVAKAQTMSEIEAANGLHRQATAALRTKDVREAASGGMLDLIGHAEGTDKGRGYNETLAYGAYTGGNRNLVLMTLDEIDALQTAMLRHPDNEFNSSAAGRYQIVQQTLRGLRDQLDLSGDELFSPELQDRLAQQLLRRRGNDVAGLRNEWEGLRNVDDATISAAYDASSLTMPAVDPMVADRRQIDQERAREQVEAYQQIIASARAYTAEQRVEQQALTMTATQAAALRYEQALLNEAQRAGIQLSPQQRQQLQQLAAGMAQAESATARVARSQAELQAVQGFLGSQIGGLFTSIVTGSATAEQALARLGAALADAAFQAALFGQGPLAGLMGGGAGILGTLLGFGGGVVAAATGGLIRGPGTGTSDSIPARLSDGEYVVNARATAKHRALLHAINSGAPIAGFAAGGLVGTAANIRAASAAPAINVVNNVKVEGSAGTPEQNADLARQMTKQLEGTMRGVIVDEMRQQMRGGNMIGRR